MRSDNIKKGIARTPHRSLLMASGVSKENMQAPFIGIASSFSDLVPGHVGMRDLERQIEKGIHRLLYLGFLLFVTESQWGTAECNTRFHQGI